MHDARCTMQDARRCGSRVQAWRRSLLGALPLLAAPLARKLVAAFRRGDFVDLPKKTAKFQVTSLTD